MAQSFCFSSLVNSLIFSRARTSCSSGFLGDEVILGLASQRSQCMPRYFSKLYHTRPVWQESLSASSRTRPRPYGWHNTWPSLYPRPMSSQPIPQQHDPLALPKKTRIINQAYKQSSIIMCTFVQERRCTSVPGLNPFLGMETSHASSDFEAWPYPEVTEELIPQNWPRN